MVIRTVILFVLLAIIPCGRSFDSERASADEKAANAVTLESLNWLTGQWIGEDKGVVTEEYWMAPKGGIMPGVNRSVSAKGKASFEFMRIAETPEGLTYFASPGGRKATPFLLKEGSDKHVMFESKTNDFPTRIIYRRKNELLTARIEGVIDSKEQSMEWEWKPANP